MDILNKVTYSLSTCSPMQNYFHINGESLGSEASQWRIQGGDRGVRTPPSASTHNYSYSPTTRALVA